MGSTLKWDPPSPGPWQQDSAHNPVAQTALLQRAVELTEDASAASAWRHSSWIACASTVIAAACTRSGSTTWSSVSAAGLSPSGRAPPAQATAWRTMSADDGEKSTAQSTSGV